MRSLMVAFLITFILAGTVFFLARATLVDADFAGSIYENGIPLAISGAVLLLLPYIHQTLQGRNAARLSITGLPEDIQPFERYLLPWQTLLVYGTLFVFAANGLAIFIFFLIGQATGFFLTRAISALNLLIVSLAFYLVGGWVGKRGDKQLYLTTLGIVVAFSLLSVLTSTLLLDNPPRLLAVLAVSGLYVIIALIGLWRGRKARQIRYIQYLLDFVPRERRIEVVDAVYEQVRQVTYEQPEAETETAGNSRLYTRAR